MFQQAKLESMQAQGRTITEARTGDSDLGPFALLPGEWKNLPGLPGRGWNMIALPFATEPGSPFNYRLLVNQYNEELKFTIVDKAVPNRGISRSTGVAIDTDQLIVTLDYEQTINQIASDDFPQSGKAGNPGAAIHHEPGLWLYMLNENIDGLDIARLSTIPHGNSVLALGKSEPVANGAPVIGEMNALPEGVSPNLNSPYLAPYNHFRNNLFQGIFDPTRPNDLLNAANSGVNILRTTTLSVDTTTPTGGITNIPFVVKQADAASMRSTFWIQELADLDQYGNNKLRLQYSQVVMLDFFPRRDGLPGLIRWPHISINTLEKIVS